ncbi:MAG: hypothetical protein AABW59_00560 [archaeon]
MNEKGNLLVIILFVMVGLIFLLPVLMYVFPPLDIIVRIILVFSIFMTVRGYMGNGILTIIISAILIYFLVFKWWWIGASGFFAMTLLSLGFFGIVVWGTSKIIPQH